MSEHVVMWNSIKRYRIVQDNMGNQYRVMDNKQDISRLMESNGYVSPMHIYRFIYVLSEDGTTLLPTAITKSQAKKLRKVADSLSDRVGHENISNMERAWFHKKFVHDSLKENQDGD